MLVFSFKVGTTVWYLFLLVAQAPTQVLSAVVKMETDQVGRNTKKLFVAK